MPWEPDVQPVDQEAIKRETEKVIKCTGKRLDVTIPGTNIVINGGGDIRYVLLNVPEEYVEYVVFKELLKQAEDAAKKKALEWRGG